MFHCRWVLCVISTSQLSHEAEGKPSRVLVCHTLVPKLHSYLVYFTIFLRQPEFDSHSPKGHLFRILVSEDLSQYRTCLLT